MVKKGTVNLKQSPMVLPAAHCAANGDNGTGVSNSNMIDKKTIGLLYNVYFEGQLLGIQELDEKTIFH